MGTISDKLMRIINTKEDIRQALISKGYDVPTSIPFKEYAKMISDLPCRVDSFPDIEGIVARYSALGLTNEQMATNPVWVDKTGNGRDLQMKNFFWGGMSGVGGYVQDFNYFKNNATVDKIRIDEQNSNSIKVTLLTSGMGHVIYIPKDVYQFNKSYFIKISSEGYNEGDLFLSFYAPSTSTATTVKVPLNPNGITEIPAIKEDDFLAVYLFNAAGKVGSITIEQLPLYPGALVFDGVDDYGVCDNFPILTKEKGYTVVALRQWITYNPNAISAIATNASDQSFNGAFTFENYNKGAEQTISYGATQITLQYSKSPFSWQTTSKYNGVNIANGKKDATNSLVLGRSYPQRNEFANFAIWELVFLDHDATEEELTKIKDYFVKTYPWLFPDQAWTVTGKTNEDEDRATIANITGNGNDLVLSNFGFAKGSGYGLYYQYFGEKFATTNGEIEDGGWNKIDNYNISHNKRIPINSIGKCYWSNEVFANGIKLRFKLTGMTEGDVLAFGYAGTYDLTYTSDGIYVIDLPPVDKTYGFSLQSSLTENLPTTPVTIKLLPFEYEGYLVTDGVDDKINSSNFDLGKDWTIVGDWTMLSNIPSNCGIIKASSLFLYNSIDSVTIYINNGGRPIKIQSKSINAICSDGRIYLNDWTEISKPGVQTELGSKANLNITSYGTTFTKMAFKNLAIYDGKILSKDECIKAYNYLQTLKSK
ncbi:MAG: hypothetical protein [Bacteriophage sp.]|nr:MAG: hypothetical protein [Bacteriophage sp.]